MCNMIAKSALVIFALPEKPCSLRSAQRTKVIDDQTDYFSYEDEKYMTPAQRRETQRKRKEMMTLKNMPRSQMPMNMNIDVATGAMSSGVR